MLSAPQLREAAQGDIEVMIEAAKNCPELAVRVSGSGKSVDVRRTRPLPEKDDSERRTVYLEGLTEFCTIEQVQELMGKFGPVRFSCLHTFPALDSVGYISWLRLLSLTSVLSFLIVDFFTCFVRSAYFSLPRF